jgi:dolichol kinase
MNWDGKTAGSYAAIIGTVGLINEVIRLNFQRANAFYLNLVKNFARIEESNKFSGLTYYAFGVAISFYFFSWEIANLSIWYLIFADPISAFMGNKFGKKMISKNKSYLGCGSFYLVCFIINLVYLNLSDSDLKTNLIFLILSPLVGAISEFIVIKDDNLSIPLISAIGLTILAGF